MKIREGRFIVFNLYLKSRVKNEVPKLALGNQIYFPGSKYSKKPFYNMGSIHEL